MNIGLHLLLYLGYRGAKITNLKITWTKIIWEREQFSGGKMAGFIVINKIWCNINNSWIMWYTAWLVSSVQCNRHTGIDAILVYHLCHGIDKWDSRVPADTYLALILVLSVTRCFYSLEPWVVLTSLMWYRPVWFATLYCNVWTCGGGKDHTRFTWIRVMRMNWWYKYVTSSVAMWSVEKE